VKTLKPLQLALSLIPVAVIIIGLIGWVVTLRGNIDSALGTIEELQEVQQENSELLADVVTRQALVENEMRQIMADHSGFNDVLRELGESGLITERRQYGNYGE
jgi:hypothetical protein